MIRPTTGCLGAWLILSCLIPSQAQSEALSRYEKEGYQLFRDYLGRQLATKGKCSVSDKWSNVLVPQEVAGKYFGLRIWANLAPASIQFFSQPSVSIIVDPERRAAQVFCSQKEEDELKESLRVEAEKLDTSQPKIKLDNQRFWERTSYSFPVFSDRFTRAIMTSYREGSGYAKWPDGTTKRCCAGVAADAQLFAKRKGVWVWVRDEEIFRVH